MAFLARTTKPDFAADAFFIATPPRASWAAAPTAPETPRTLTPPSAAVGFACRRWRALVQAAALIIAILTSPTGSDAAAIITIIEEDGSVVARGTGSINTDSLITSSSSFALEPGGLFGTPPAVRVGPAGDVTLGRSESLSGPMSIGPLAEFVAASEGSGDRFGVSFFLQGPPVGTPSISVPRDYLSGTPLSGLAEYEGESLASLGLTPGTYVWTWGSGDATDSLSVIIRVPEPTGLAAGAAALLPAVLVRRRRSSAPQKLLGTPGPAC